MSADSDNVGGGRLWVRSKASSNSPYLKVQRRKPGIVSSDLQKVEQEREKERTRRPTRVASTVNYPVSTLWFIVIGCGVYRFFIYKPGEEKELPARHRRRPKTRIFSGRARVQGA